jgi:hypothetical protein
MNGRNKAARVLVALAAMVLIASALLHLSDYPKDLSAVSASNLRAPLQRAVRSLYFLVGLDWIVIAIIMLISAFTMAKVGKVIILFCGFAVLVNMAVMLACMGRFIGTDMVLASALMALCGGLLFQMPQAASAGQDAWSR